MSGLLPPQPRGWAGTRLSEIAHNLRSKQKPDERPTLPFIGMEHVEAHTMRLLATVSATTMKSAAVHFQSGDVLYGRLRPYLNKVVAPEFEGLCSAEFIPLTPVPGVYAKFLQFRLNAADFVAFASHLDEGDRPRVDFGQIGSFAFGLPPSPEQERIVGVVEDHFSRLDEAATLLNHVQRNLKRYRASILKAAVEGRLVPTEAELARAEKRDYEPARVLLKRTLVERRRRWGAEGKRGKYEEPEAPETSGLPELPKGWCWATWSQIGFSQNGRSFPSKEYTDEGVRLLRPGNLHVSSRVVWTAKNTKHLPRRFATENPDLMIGPGELVMNLTAQSLKDEFLGRICMTNESVSLLNQRLARLTPVLVDRRYILWMFKSPLFRRFVDSLNKGSLIQHMFTSQIAEFPLPLPPLAEQERIVSEVERRLSIGDAVEKTAGQTADRQPLLRQSILKWAFEGKLVDQDPYDEPAADLLARIKGEKRTVPSRTASAPRRTPKRRS